MKTSLTPKASISQPAKDIAEMLAIETKAPKAANTLP
jgi:hypothetical protein